MLIPAAVGKLAIPPHGLYRPVVVSPEHIQMVRMPRPRGNWCAGGSLTRAGDAEWLVPLAVVRPGVPPVRPDRAIPACPEYVQVIRSAGRRSDAPARRRARRI